MPFLEKRLLFPLQTTLTIAAFLRGNNFNQSWCILRYHPAVLQPKNPWRWEEKIIPFSVENTYESGWMEQSLIKLLQCQETSVLNSAFLRSDVTPTIGMNGIKFQQAPNSWNMWMVLLSGFSYDPLGCIPVPRAKSLYGIKEGEGKTQFPSIFLGGPSKIFKGGKLTKPAGCPLPA